MKKKEHQIIKIQAPTAKAKEWSRQAKQLGLSRSEYLLALIQNRVRTVIDK
jgi:hypothetical protein